MKTIIVFLIIFSIIVVIHEFGHFYMARRAGIQVREFAIGMGPKLFSTQDKYGTTFTIRMLPLGGYVRVAGLYEEDEIQPGMQVGVQLNHQNQVTVINFSQQHNEDELPLRVNQSDLSQQLFIEGVPVGQDEPIRYSILKDAYIIEEDGTKLMIAPIEKRYESATPWNKIKMNVMGPINNFILSIIAFMLFAFMSGGIPSNSNEIGNVIADSPASQAGLQKGDIITMIDNIDIHDWQDVVATTRERPNQEVEVIIERDGQTESKTMQIAVVEDSVTGEKVGQIGVQSSKNQSLLATIKFGFTETWSVITGVFAVLGGMLTSGFNINNFAGPVAMAEMTGQVVQSGLNVVIWYLAMLSANIGVFNLLPVPALDGGKIVLNIIEAVRGKPLSQSKEGIITLIGFILLIILMIAVTWNDISRAFF